MRHPASVATLLALFACAGMAGQAGKPAGPDARPLEVAAGCPPERPSRGEVRLVFLGDSGYGTGSSEWGAPGQESIAGLINDLSLAPDLVFMLGDNVYWTGSESLYKARFDDMYQPLIRQCKVHVALGNHDVKGCRAVGAAETADGRLPSDASAYQDLTRGQCHAAAALKHAEFGFGATDEESHLEASRQRYYRVPWPVPRLADPAAEAAGLAAPALVDVLVADSNTLGVSGGLLEGADRRQLREDRLQLLWLRNALATPAPPGGSSPPRPWKIVTMHHSPYTPRACACKLFGHCFGGHEEDPGLQAQLRETLSGADGPDIFISAHNHIYARTHPLDAAGQPVLEGSGGLRYFVTGGGGGPLYAIETPDRRFARALTMYHFLYLRLTAGAAFFWAVDHDGRVRDSGCFERGSNVDRPLSRDFGYADPLPPGCAPPRG